MAGALTAAIAAAFAGSAAPSSDPYFEYTTLLLPGNGTNGAQNNTFLDGSTNNFTITRNGNTTQGTFSPFSQTGWGNYFDGTGDYLTATNNAAYDFGTGNFTVETWAYITSYTGGATDVIISNYQNSTNGWTLGIFSTTGKFYFAIAGDYEKIDDTAALPLNQWVHLAAVRSSTTMSLFVNGTRAATTTNSTNNTSTSVLTIGTNVGGGALNFNGYLSNTRVVKGTAVYDPTQTTLTVPTAPLTAISGTSLLTCQSNRFIDNSSNNFTITKNGDTSVVAFSPFNPSASWSAATYGGSGYFDGSGDYLSVAYNSNLQLGSSDFTIEFWFYSTGAQGASDVLANGYSSGTNLNWLIQADVSTMKFYASTTGNSWAVSALTVGAIVHNQWNHFAIVRSGTTVTPYLNGVAGTTGSLTGSIFANTSAIAIGTDNSSPSTNNIQGYIGPFRIVIGTAVYTGNFTPPTSPLTAITNTALLLNFTNAGIYDATSKNDLETVGNAQISTTQSKWGGSSIAFDGTGDYLVTNVSTSDLYSFGTGDWTVEFWVRFNNTTGDGCIFDTRNATDTLNVSILRSTTTIIFQTGGATRITSGTITSNVWYHVALARSGTSTKMFIDGTQAGSTYTDTTSYTAGANRPIVGAVSLSGFVGISALNGYVNDLRVTKGYARYTANFTAPTAAFPTL